MDILKQKILQCAQVIDDRIIKVDSFLNHQLDIKLFNEIGKEFKKRFADREITKILTVEASGIALASITAQYFDVPVLFAKKHDASNLGKDTYESDVYSFTKDKSYKIRVSKEYLQPQDKVLIIDDFLAKGNAMAGLIDIVEQAKAEVAGIGIVIEKSAQKGRAMFKEHNSKLESLVIIESMNNGEIIFK